jgi:hypothetical protein
LNANASISNSSLNDAAIGDDLVSGGKRIAAFWKMPERKARHLMTTGQLPGAFQLGGLWYQSKSAAREDIRARALASVKAVGAR